MIPTSLIRTMSAELEVFRSKAANLVSYDDSSRGNFSNHGEKIVQIFDKLDKHDPTGFASALLFDEMVESVMISSTVPLHRVLREKGYLRSLEKIAQIKGKLSTYIELPREEFITRLTDSLGKIISMEAELSTRAVAACMRDAIYAIDGGLKLRWLRCSVEAEGDMSDVPDLALCPDIRHFATVSDFVDCLTSELNFGAHVACIAGEFTAIGLKQPGRVAYLSTLTINKFSGNFSESRSDQYNASQFDLTKPAERYPDWKVYALRNGTLTIEGQTNSITKLADLKQDQILWLALVVEMTKLKMAATQPGTIVLAETMSRALASANIQMLPALRSNYVIETKSILELFGSFEFNDWTRNYMRPALEGLTVDHLLPVTDEPTAFNVITFEHSRVKTQVEGYAHSRESDTYFRDHITLNTVSPSLTGTKEEVENIRNWVLGRNLLTYLMRYANTQFARAYVTETFPMFKKRITKVARKAMNASFAKAGPFGQVPPKLYLYTQSSKHKEYKARCYFDDTLTPTHFVGLSPQNSSEIAEMLCLKSEHELPEYLHGWERTKNGAGVGPENYSVQVIWAWNKMSEGFVSKEAFLIQGLTSVRCTDMNHFCEVVIAAHESNIPSDLLARQSTESLQWFEQPR